MHYAIKSHISTKSTTIEDGHNSTTVRVLVLVLVCVYKRIYAWTHVYIVMVK